MKLHYLVIVFALLLTGCSGDKPDTDIWTAAATGNIAVLQQHLDYGTDVDEREQLGGSTPLIVAALVGQDDSARFLVTHGAEIDATNNDGSTALHTAAFFVHPEIVSLLLENGASVGIRNKSGATPLDAVSGEWSPELEQLYQMLGDAFQLQLDLDRIRNTRPEIAQMIRQYGE